MNNVMFLNAFAITEPEDDFYIYSPGWLNVWESHLYNQALKATAKRGWGFKRFGTSKAVYAREMVRKPDYIHYIEALEQAAERAMQGLAAKERMLLLKSRTAFLYVDAWGESAIFENISSALHTSTIDTLPKNLLKKFAIKNVSGKMRGEKLSLIAAMRLAQDYLCWNTFDFVVVCAAWRAIPLLVFSEAALAGEAGKRRAQQKSGIHLSVERAGCFIFSRRAGGISVRCGNYHSWQDGAQSQRELYENASDIDLFAQNDTTINLRLPEQAANTLDLSAIFGASGCLTPALSWEYLQQHAGCGTKIRTIVNDSFGGSAWFDSWFDIERGEG
ncbi:ATP-binding protein [Kosakonia cowanii]|uniref:ATP-binding protein n=1 Tax=Kosakonia cowanii TaxID=208223 RepID=UPI0023F821A0|nr:ATP-binding protein [Kosakonia cowanii]MDF7761100.1 ATP-binding protein [Kosakonia cowanii]